MTISQNYFLPFALVLEWVEVALQMPKYLSSSWLDRVHAKSRIINSFSQVTDKYQYDEEGATIFYVSLWRHCLQPEQRFSKPCVRWEWLSYALFTLSCEIDNRWKIAEMK